MNDKPATPPSAQQETFGTNSIETFNEASPGVFKPEPVIVPAQQQEGLDAEVAALLKRVDEDARGTRCLTMAEVTLCLNALRALAAHRQSQASGAPPMTFEQGKLAGRSEEAAYWEGVHRAQPHLGIVNCTLCKHLDEILNASPEAGASGAGEQDEDWRTLDELDYRIAEAGLPILPSAIRDWLGGTMKKLEELAKDFLINESCGCARGLYPHPCPRCQVTIDEAVELFPDLKPAALAATGATGQPTPTDDYFTQNNPSIKAAEDFHADVEFIHAAHIEGGIQVACRSVFERREKEARQRGVEAERERQASQSEAGFSEWWLSEGINHMPTGDQPPEHAAIAKLAWQASRSRQTETQVTPNPLASARRIR